MSTDVYEQPTDEKMTTPQLTEKLHTFYAQQQGWAFITQVRSTTGYASTVRTADAMAMGLWPSSGLRLIGFELKVSRSDWLHELKQPDKAEEIKQFCDEWYLVVPDPSIVKDGELPEGWGLMTATGRGHTVKVKKKAVQLEPIDVDRAFLASIFRNITEKNMPLDRHVQILNEQLDDQKRWIERENQQKFDKADEAQRQIKEFEGATGIPFTSWNDPEHVELAKVVKSALGGKYDEVEKKLTQLREKSVNITKFIDGEIEGYRV